MGWKQTYTEDLQSGLSRLFNSSQYTDTEIIVEGKTFHSHRIVLSSVSQYFNAMYSCGMRESKNGVVTLHGVDGETFESVLKFVYSGCNVLNTENTQKILQAAVMLQIRCLQQCCEEFLLDNVDIDNCLAMWKLANIHSCEYLMSRLLPFVVTHFRKVWMTDDFLLMEKDELIPLIRNNDLKTPNEETVCDAVLRWIKHSEQRKQYLAEIFEHLRLPLVRAEYLVEVVEDHECVKQNNRCREIIEEAKRYHLLPARRSEFISPRLLFRNYGAYEEVICCVGGSGTASRRSQRVICFSPFQKNWFILSPMVYDPGIEFAACSYGNAIFVSGGSGKLEGLMFYQSMQNSWFECESLLMGRRRHSMVAVSDSLFVIGGYNDALPEGLRTLSSVEEFSITTGCWKDVGDLLLPVRSASAAVISGKIFVFGGILEDDTDTKTVQCFDTRSHFASFICEMPFACGLTSAIVMNREVYLVTPEGKILTFSEEADVVLRAEISDFHRCGFDLVQHGGKILVLGGIDSNNTYDQILSFDPANTTIDYYPEALPSPLFGFGCVKTVINKSFLQELLR